MPATSRQFSPGLIRWRVRIGARYADRTAMTVLRYLQAYPPHLQQQVRQMIDSDRLGEYLHKRYPERHEVQSDKALYGYAQELRQRFLRSAPPLDKVLFDNRLDLTHRALGLNTAVSRV
jgi:UTP pyrophosphatase